MPLLEKLQTLMVSMYSEFSLFIASFYYLSLLDLKYIMLIILLCLRIRKLSSNHGQCHDQPDDDAPSDTVSDVCSLSGIHTSCHCHFQYLIPSFNVGRAFNNSTGA